MDGFQAMCHKSSRPAFAASSMPVKVQGTIRRWLVDTGAGQHVVGKSHLTKQQLASMVKSDPITLVTASGVIIVYQIVEFHVDELGFAIWAYVLPESPPALSAGRLCRYDGCRLEWSDGADNAVLIGPDGRVLTVTTIARCP